MPFLKVEGAMLETNEDGFILKTDRWNEEVAAALVGTIEGLLLQWLVDPDFDLIAHFGTAWEILTGGLRA